MFTEVGVSSVRGPRDLMQDAYMQSAHALAVFDGHRPRGHTVAITCSEEFEAIYERQPLLTAEQVRYNFAMLDSRFRGRAGGTTATLLQAQALPDGTREVKTFWVGDSPAYVISPPRLGSTEGVIKMTREHNTGNPEEVARLRSYGIYAVASYFVVNDQFSIAVSRAIGDTLETDAIIAEPEVNNWNANPGDLVVLATDGVINLDNEAEVVYEVADLYVAGKGLQAIASRMTQIYAEQTYDNATMLLGALK